MMQPELSELHMSNHRSIHTCMHAQAQGMFSMQKHSNLLPRLEHPGFSSQSCHQSSLR
jgi:hypothetical protein